MLSLRLPDPLEGTFSLASAAAGAGVPSPPPWPSAVWLPGWGVERLLSPMRLPGAARLSSALKAEGKRPLLKGSRASFHYLTLFRWRVSHLPWSLQEQSSLGDPRPKPGIARCSQYLVPQGSNSASPSRPGWSREQSLLRDHGSYWSKWVAYNFQSPVFMPCPYPYAPFMEALGMNVKSLAWVGQGNVAPPRELDEGQVVLE
uniref:Uncharacterized protein n=1 Tax=Sphaerodactylus townsendi TaxID=933632 RepID=A0ACB8GCB1_9SAUR